MRRFRWAAGVFALALSVALGGCSGGSESQPSVSRDTEPPVTAQSAPPAKSESPRGMRPSVVLKGKLALSVNGFTQFPARIVGGSSAHHTFRYVLQSEIPARGMLKEQGMSLFLREVRFGVPGRPMSVRLLDREGRLAWSAGYDGRRSTWVRAGKDFSGCGPVSYARDRKLLTLQARDGATCALEPLPKSAVTVLR